MGLNEYIDSQTPLDKDEKDGLKVSGIEYKYELDELAHQKWLF